MKINLRSQTIMVIDDCPMMEAMLGDILGETYQMNVFENGLDAFRFMYAGNIPDIIISDYHIPELNGYEFLTQLKSSSMFCDIPVIILSAEESSTIKVECLEAGAEDFIIKPFSPPELLARIKLILNRSKSSQHQKEINSPAMIDY